jgi:hypothetical protein
MFATIPLLDVAQRTNNNMNGTTASSSTMLTADDLIALHQIQQQLDTTSAHSVGISFPL